MAVKTLSYDARKLFETNLELAKTAFAGTTAQIEKIYSGCNGSTHLAIDQFGELLIELQKNLIDAKGYEDSLGSLYNRTAEWVGSESTPIHINFDSENERKFMSGVLKCKIQGKLFLYKNHFFEVTDPCDAEGGRLMLIDYVNKLNRKIEYLRSRPAEKDTKPDLKSRKPIPQDVKIEVWRRDEGKCVACNSVVNLEYDHIIPVSLGGSSTTRNIQLLCEVCNRAKSNKIM